MHEYLFSFPPFGVSVLWICMLLHVHAYFCDKAIHLKQSHLRATALFTYPSTREQQHSCPQVSVQPEPRTSGRGVILSSSGDKSFTSAKLPNLCLCPCCLLVAAESSFSALYFAASFATFSHQFNLLIFPEQSLSLPLSPPLVVLSELHPHPLLFIPFAIFYPFSLLPHLFLC